MIDYLIYIAFYYINFDYYNKPIIICTQIVESL